jgi:hypothetical protein
MNELRWMFWRQIRRENPAGAAEILQRRLQDEPLAYVLGIILVHTFSTVLTVRVKVISPSGTWTS